MREQAKYMDRLDSEDTRREGNVSFKSRVCACILLVRLSLVEIGDHSKTTM